VLFNQPRYAIAFPSEYPDRAQELGDDMLTSHAEPLWSECESESTVERVRGMLRLEDEIAVIHVRRVAQRLGLSVRALRRRLDAERASLSGLLDEARLRIAQSELRKPGVSIKQAAHALGFSVPSAFHRAFKRWGGQTPTQYIKHFVTHSSSSSA
jgi:AraC-like DNA-binding protein